MDYEEIKDKYKEAAVKRKASITLAEAKVEALKALREEYKEKLNQLPSEISHETRHKANLIWMDITRVNKKISDAELDLARISIGGDEVLDDIMKNWGLS